MESAGGGIACSVCGLRSECLAIQFSDHPSAHTVQSILHSGWGILLFILLTVETLDAFEVAKDLAQDDSNTLTYLQNIQQISLSGVWLLYSIVLMCVGLWRRLRGLRIFAMVLFGITIVKSFFFDLSFLETLYRIYSFFVLGLILVGVLLSLPKIQSFYL